MRSMSMTSPTRRDGADGRFWVWKEAGRAGTIFILIDRQSLMPDARRRFFCAVGLKPGARRIERGTSSLQPRLVALVRAALEYGTNTEELTMGQQRTIMLAMSVTTVAITTLCIGQDGPKVGFSDTPILPGGKWHVHDGARPIPRVITPGECSTQHEPGAAPSDAVVLFDGKDLSHWRGRRGQPAGWKLVEGALVIQPGAGELVSAEEFGDCQLHLEFASPVPPRGRDQGRGNSGVMFFGRYEIQVLDSYQNLTYADGQAAAIYGQYPPLVNASRPAGQWQSYDIVFNAPRFKEDGSLEAPAYVTVLHNGVLVHNHTAVIGAMAYRAVGTYRRHGPKGPLVLQDHGNPVRFRNIWVRELKAYDQP